MTSVTKRLGVISPSPIQLPWELSALLPEAAITATVVSVRAYTAHEFERANSALEQAIDQLAAEDVGAVLVLGVPLAATRGRERERADHASWTARAGVPVTSGLAALVEGLARDRSRRPLVVTAYPAHTNADVARYLRAAGLDAHVEGAAVSGPSEAGRADPASYAALARELCLRHVDRDAVVLAARGNLDQVARSLAGEVGRPVLHQHREGAEWARRALGVAA